MFFNQKQTSHYKVSLFSTQTEKTLATPDKNLTKSDSTTKFIGKQWVVFFIKYYLCSDLWDRLGFWLHYFER